MEKIVLVVVDGVPTFNIAVKKNDTIGSVKLLLKKYDNYSVKMLLNPNTEVKVFDTKKYNSVNFDSVWDQMKDTVIYLTQRKVEETTQPIQINQRVFTKNKEVDIQILSELSYEDLMKTCQVNKYVSELCKNNMLWRNKLAKDFPLRSKFIYDNQYKNLYAKNPRKLYEIISAPSKTITIFEEEFPEIKKIVPDEDDLDPNDDEDISMKLKIITESIRTHLDILPLLRGDVILLDWIGGYRNDGKLMWDGEKVISLYYELDDYGSVPIEFTFPEFPLNHFKYSISHNNIIWLSSTSVQEAISNFNEDTQQSFITDGYKSYIVKALSEDVGHMNSEEFAIFINKNPIIDNFESGIYGIANYYYTVFFK